MEKIAYIVPNKKWITEVRVMQLHDAHLATRMPEHS